VVWEGGAGKTIAGIVWTQEGGRQWDPLIVCPKQIVEKWKDAFIKFGIKKYTVVSKEDFKKLENRLWSCIIIDEADTFASPLFTRGRSQLTTKMYELIKYMSVHLDGETPHVLCLTATPVRSNPYNLHTLMTFTGNYVDWKRWRNEYFVLEKRPYMPRMAWFPKKDWRQRIRPVLEKYADIVLLKDCVTDLPPITEEKVLVKCDKFIPGEWEPTKAFFEEHRHEQKHKPEEIIKLSAEYRKVVVVAFYVEQVESLAKELSKDRETFFIHGGVKDHEGIIKKAQESDECFIVIQASIGSGFDLDTFSCCIFASMSYAVRDFVQMRFRLRRIHNLHPVAYYYLLAGRCDKSIIKNVELGKDFVPSMWII
jgi:superfamily II DNA or RNA helicase